MRDLESDYSRLFMILNTISAARLPSVTRDGIHNYSRILNTIRLRFNFYLSGDTPALRRLLAAADLPMGVPARAATRSHNVHGEQSNSLMQREQREQCESGRGGAGSCHAAGEQGDAPISWVGCSKWMNF